MNHIGDIAWSRIRTQLVKLSNVLAERRVMTITTTNDRALYYNAETKI